MASANVLEEVFEKLLCVNPLTVSSRELPSGSARLRLCWDGSRFINSLLKPLGVKLCHFPIAANLLYEGDYQVSMDMKSFYYHLMIFPAHKTHLGVASEPQDGVTRYFHVRVWRARASASAHTRSYMYMHADPS